MLIRGLSTPLRHRPQSIEVASQGGLRLFADFNLYNGSGLTCGRARGLAALVVRESLSLLGGNGFGWQGGVVPGAVDDGAAGYASGQAVIDAFASANPDGPNRIGLLQSQGRRRCIRSG